MFPLKKFARKGFVTSCMVSCCGLNDPYELPPFPPLMYILQLCVFNRYDISCHIWGWVHLESFVIRIPILSISIKQSYVYGLIFYAVQVYLISTICLIMYH